MNHPKYNLNDQVQVKTGQGSSVLKVTGIKQDTHKQPFRYESQSGDEIRFFSEDEVIAVLRNGNWQPAQNEPNQDNDSEDQATSGNIASLWH
jgi:hypothetical protein